MNARLRDITIIEARSWWQKFMEDFIDTDQGERLQYEQEEEVTDGEEIVYSQEA